MRNITQSKMRFLSAFILLLSQVLYAQDTLTYVNYLELVKTFHPTAQRAALQRDMGDAIVQFARGNFDPVVQSKLKEKYFQDKHYYTLFNSEVAIPTITGIELKAGYGDNAGVLLNPENYTPKEGTGYVGVSVPIGKGMFTDENRAGLRMAQQQQVQQQALSELTINDLLLEASLAYWEWYKYHYMAENLKNAVQISVDRFNFVRQEYFVGESAANDTLKAFLQWQDRYQDYFEAKRSAIEYFLKLNTFLWDDTLALKEGLMPQTLTFSTSQLTTMDEVNEAHPSLKYYQAKRMEAIAGRRLKVEKLKPKLNFDYMLLSEGIVPEFNGFGDNQVWGLSFEFPLLVRSERADLRMAKIKIEDAHLMYNIKQRELTTKLSNQYQQSILLREQVQTLERSIDGYVDLVEAEQLKYRLGESTLFELNAWEQRMIDNQNKFLSLSSKLSVSDAKINWIKAVWE